MAKERKNKRNFDTTDEAQNKIKLCIVKPDNTLREKADLKYRVSFSEAVRQGMLTRSEAQKIIKDRGLSSERNDKDIREKRDSLRKMEIKLRRADDVTKGSKIAEKMGTLRGEIEQLTSEQTELLNNTAESHADDVRLHFYVAHCVMDPETDELHFGGEDEYNRRSNERAALDAYFQMILFLNDMAPDFIQKRPENNWRIQKRLMDKDGYLINNEGQKVDGEGRLVNDELRFVDNSGGYVDDLGYPIDENGNIDFDRLDNKDGVEKEQK